SAVEHTFLAPENRTTSAEDCAWGALDGLTGIFGSACEAKVGSQFARAIGQKALGRQVAVTAAEEAGLRLVNNSLGKRFVYNGLRSFSGGVAGTAAFSLPHSLYEHSSEIAADPATGLKRAAGQFATETAVGGIFCGTVSPLFTAIGARKQIFSKL